MTKRPIAEPPPPPPAPNPEKRLYVVAQSLPLSDDFFTEFPSAEQIMALGRSLAIRRLVVIVANSETPAKDVIPAARLLLTLSGDIKDDDEVVDGERVSAELATAMSRVKHYDESAARLDVDGSQDARVLNVLRRETK